jgi:hypothetical protein
MAEQELSLPPAVPAAVPVSGQEDEETPVPISVPIVPEVPNIIKNFAEELLKKNNMPEGTTQIISNNDLESIIKNINDLFVKFGDSVQTRELLNDKLNESINKFKPVLYDGTKKAEANSDILDNSEMNELGIILNATSLVGKGDTLLKNLIFNHIRSFFYRHLISVVTLVSLSTVKSSENNSRILELIQSFIDKANTISDKTTKSMSSEEASAPIEASKKYYKSHDKFHEKYLKYKNKYLALKKL